MIFEPGADDDFLVVDEIELELSPEEQLMLSEPGDLAEWRRKKIIAAHRTLMRGDLMDLLGLPGDATNSQLKKAYYELAKAFHPDRFHGRELGSFAPMLDRIFDAAKQAVTILSDTRTSIPDHELRGHARKTVRFAHEHQVNIESTLWPTYVRAATLDLSAGGVFISTDATVQRGMRVRLHLPGVKGGPLVAAGTVAWTRSATDAAALGLARGFGVRFELPLRDPNKMVALLDFARLGQVAPAKRPYRPGRVRLTGRQPIVAIDLGTTNTVVSAAFDDGVHVIPWAHGVFSVPSAVAFPRGGAVVFGTEAKKFALREPSRSVLSIKRLFGRGPDEPEVQGLLGETALDVSAGPDGLLCVRVDDQTYSTVQLFGYLLGQARDAAEATLKAKVTRAVLTAPVSATPEHRELMRRAARLVGLEVVHIVDEPSAAVLANRRVAVASGLLGVFDLGGGTFDFSLVERLDGEFRVLATAGDSWLGGDDFDRALANAVANVTWRSRRIELRDRKVEYQRLLAAAEYAKRELSQSDTATVVVKDLLRDRDGLKDLSVRVTRHQAEALWEPLLRRAYDTCMQAMTLKGLHPSQLEQLFLCGGGCRVPAVQQTARALCENVLSGVPVEYAACLGAGVLAGQLEQRISKTA